MINVWKRSEVLNKSGQAGIYRGLRALEPGDQPSPDEIS